ncbi:MAG: LPS-assembly protein LptD [Hellea sp.]|nr:LPS-assembly protein LptD [Hellea sp.]
MIYLEADELINDDSAQTLIARGDVEGRYQDRSIRADEVTYYVEEGRVIATGNVILVNADGSSQFAEKLELSNELETGTAYNFTSRLPNGGVTGAAYATRRGDEGVDLYNAYYTACEPCEESDKSPTWQIKAKRVSQDTERNLILYKDAVFELFGIPVLYTPYLAHPDPSQDRATGWLNPFGGYSSSKGAFIELPYYVKLDDYSELTLTPHLFTGVNPLLEADYRRKFYSGELNINSSATYASAFDRNGDPFLEGYTYLSNPDDAPTGRRLRSHFFADGQFGFGDNWDWGFTAQLASDDLYLSRYDLDDPGKVGLYDGDTRRLISQLFALGQSDNFRFSASAYGFQSLRTNILEDPAPNTFRITREDDSTLPIVAPKIEASYFIEDPVLGGRIEAFGDFTMLNREIGTDYRRGTAGLAYNKTLILPAGIEVKPFGEVRYDNFDITPYDAANDVDLQEVGFDRTLGQLGMDIRWPFIKSTGSMEFIVEPRAMITQSFGDGKLENIRADLNNDNVYDFNYLQDSLDVDFDHNLIWSPNKTTGYDLWQEGFRADVGGSISALWGNSYTSLFVGQSFADNVDNVFELESGLQEDKSDLVGQFEVNLSNKFIFDTRVRYDEDDKKFRRLDTGFRYASDRVNARLRYYKVDQANLLLGDNAPSEEINGSISLNVTKNVRLSYGASRDLDRDETRRQSFALGYIDDCTLIELFYQQNNFANDAVRDSDSIGLRISLLSLGQFGGNNQKDRF